MKINRRSAGIVAGAVAIGLGIATFNSYRDLSETRSSAAAAWQDVGEIHAARERIARVALDEARQAGRLSPRLVENARSVLSRASTMPAAPRLLDDPQALDNYKRYQGELTGALFGLAYSAAPASGSASLDALRSELPRYETALTQARLRYRQAASKHNAIARSLPGAAAALLTGNGAVPAQL